MQKEAENNKKQIDTSDSDFDTEGSKKLEYTGEFYGEFPYYIGIGAWSPFAWEVQEEIFEGVLQPLESASLVCLFEDAIDELIILKYIIGAPVITWDLNYKTPAERYTRRLSPVRIFPEVDSKPVLTSPIKLQRDRDSIEEVFTLTTKTLLEDRNYSPLSTAVESLRKQEEDDIDLVQELKRNLIHLKELRIRLDEKRKQDEREEKERDELMYQLQDELDDVKLKCDLEERFVDKWENVRNAQNNWKLSSAESFFKTSIHKLSTKIKIEKRVTHELQLYLRTCQAELEEQLEEWMARYDSEMERRENKILHLKYNRDQAEEKKHQLRQLYQERTASMKDWIEFREIRKRRIGASLVIQSWWRGMMVRKKLGPYKPKKPKGQKKK